MKNTTMIKNIKTDEIFVTNLSVKQFFEENDWEDYSVLGKAFPATFKDGVYYDSFGEISKSGVCDLIVRDGNDVFVIVSLGGDKYQTGGPIDKDREDFRYDYWVCFTDSTMNMESFDVIKTVALIKREV